MDVFDDFGDVGELEDLAAAVEEGCAEQDGAGLRLH